MRSGTHHPLPQDQTIRGVGTDLQFYRFWRVVGTKSQKKL